MQHVDSFLYITQMSSDTDTTPDDEQQDHTDSDQAESKSQRKRNARQITSLAAELVAMKPKVLATLPIEPSVLDAITHCAEIKAHGARKRQLHFVSKLLRESANIDDIQKLVSRPDLKKTASSVNPHQAFRDGLLDNLSDNVDQLRNSYPDADLQLVRQLVRNAHNEHKKANRDVPPENEVDISSTKSAKSLLKLLAKHQ